MAQRSPVPRGGLVRWVGPSTTNKFSSSRVDGSQLIAIEKFIGNLLDGFLSGHPCIGARTLASRRSYYYAVYKDMSTVDTAVQLLKDVDVYFDQSDLDDPIVKSFLCIFTEGVQSSEGFSTLFWDFAQLVHDVDCLTHEYDPRVSSDPSRSDFELSFRGRAAFPTTLHPQHPRPSRKFAYPGFALNQSAQFNTLREQGIFEEWQRKIRTSDAAIDPSGKPNPLLADHGTQSAAAQLGQLELPAYPFRARKPADHRHIGDALVSRARAEQSTPATMDYLETALHQKG